MWFRNALVLTALATLGLGAAVPASGLEVASSTGATEYDAIIVGGGPAGLSALSGLARVRRNVLLIDSGVYRNDPTRQMHDVLGFDGVRPAYFRYAARQQIAHYKTVSMVNATVTKIEPQNNNTLFEVLTDDPTGASKTYRARKIVLATGMRDILPATPGIKDAWGKGIYWCPWCDGHEYADQPLGLFAPLADVPGLVREMITLNADVVAFVNGTDTPDAQAATDKKFPDWRIYLDIHNVTVDNRTIERLTRLKEDKDDHDPSLPSPVERAAFLSSWPSEQASDVGEEMGVTLYGGRLAADQTKGLVTNIPGVYAIGDANSDNITNVPHALFSGKRTAVFLHVALERENALEEIKEAKEGSKKERDLELEPRAVWEVMNGEPGEPLFAGEYRE
ncbi:thioredoxin reductase like protein [Verticillium longisporum]|uniref:Thioredoxin reductase like protein n=1 Tax=Verticillium longisporum TaxID=100787 RepID=A0A8I3A098_VERLO|nr:thioredoxin reductase like protein [Verticillium longisporum]